MPSGNIESIVKAEMFVVRTTDDREGEQVHFAAFMPHTNRVMIIQSAKISDLRSGGSAFKGFAPDAEKELIRRIKGEPAPEPTAPSKNPKLKARPGQRAPSVK